MNTHSIGFWIEFHQLSQCIFKFAQTNTSSQWRWHWELDSQFDLDWSRIVIRSLWIFTGKLQTKYSKARNKHLAMNIIVKQLAVTRFQFACRAVAIVFRSTNSYQNFMISSKCSKFNDWIANRRYMHIR